jgi:cobalt/nickel transport system permease protein
MHIPDGFLDVKTAAAATLISAGGLALALRQASRQLPPRRVPLLGLAAAFVFVAQMLNFPVLAGTSGHLMGGVMTAILLGPSAAVVVLTAVLILQCLIFNDGGLSALGANIFNMALLAPVCGYGIYRGLRRLLHGQRGMVVASAFAAWCATVLAAVSCAGQLAAAGTAAWSKVFPAMASVHMLIGIGEGLITALVIVAIARVRPELIDEGARPKLRERYGEAIGLGLLAVVGMALFVAPLASPWPDGLEKIATSLGFEHKTSDAPLLSAPLPDYQVPLISSPVIGTALAGIIGAAVAFGLSFLLARLLVPKSARESADAS